MTIPDTTVLKSADSGSADTNVRTGDESTDIAGAPSKLAATLALGAIPVALGVFSRDANGQSANDVIDVLQFALLLEYLEAEFYNRGVANAAVMGIPAADLPIFTTIQAHENAHVTALRSLLTQKGATPITKPNFDFTAKGNVAGFNFGAGQYGTFQALAQAFEDTGVRAYKGQAGRLINDKATLTAALTIHSVEARHASEVRRLRNLKGWITGRSRDDLPAFTQPIYDGENNASQAGMLLFPLGNNNGGGEAVTEAFDEPLTKEQVTAIVTPFLA